MAKKKKVLYFERDPYGYYLTTKQGDLVFKTAQQNDTPAKFIKRARKAGYTVRKR